MRSSHVGFGLRWLSDILLPGLPNIAFTDHPDVEFRARSWPSFVNEGGDADLWYEPPDHSGDSRLKVFRLSQGEFFLASYSDGTDFLIHRSGSRVWCRWSPEFPFDYAATYLYGPIMGFLLRLRGVICLHSSVVGMGGWAVGFMGPGGAGKSTIAAAFAMAGFPILSDDVLALTESEGVFKATPAYPRLRLWPESVDTLFGSPEALPRITASWEKRHLDLTGENYRFESQVRPLGAIYLLGNRNDDCLGPRIGAVGGADGVSFLIANTYAYKTFDTQMREYEFGQLSQLARQVPLRSAFPYSDLTRIGRLCELIRSDFHALPRPRSVTDAGVHLHV